MLLFIQFLFCIVLGFIVYQDFKDRAVYWYLYALHFIVSIGIATSKQRWFLDSVVLNIGFLLAQYLVLAFYYSIKYKTVQVYFSKEIGTGDVIYLISIACTCIFSDFIFIYLIGAICALAWYALLTVGYKKPENIPLAAFFCLAQLSYLLLEWVDCKKYFNLQSILLDN